MKNISSFNFNFTILFSVAIFILFSSNADEKVNQNKLLLYPDEIIFYSNGSIFSPTIVLQANATVTWTWADSTTSNSLTPTKNYGTTQLRKNSLTVTPWSALQRINIGYDGLDGGSKDIELVADQNVSKVENLALVAPYLKEWCSSFNNIDTLDFSNFINIETIECLNSISLKSVNLANTPKLKRACFEENSLTNFDLSGSPALEDVRGAKNKFNTITFSYSTENIWHICVRDNPQITSSNLFNNLSIFPNIAELFIWNTNQKGNLVIPSTHPSKEVQIEAYRNQYSSIDFRGALRNTNYNGYVDLSHNNLTRIDISGCVQIKDLDLSYNKLDSLTIDQILKQVDEYGTNNGTIDLRSNAPPTLIGLVHMINLEKRGWVVNIEQRTTSSSQILNDLYFFNVYSNPSNGKIIINLDKIPTEEIVVEIRNISGMKIFEQKIIHKRSELSINKSSVSLYFITLRGRNYTKSKKVVL
ncbi:MAG TPA: T9SS type A sorting domain-containing protein [Prolixibacteraceae bacterium]|nr:T9SS type A sorting domain-containing protein [Prolixibacteraceae bacterium]